MEATKTPSPHHLATMPRRIFDHFGEELCAAPEEAAVVIVGALPPSCPDSLEARREMGRTVKVKATTPGEAAKEIQSWWGGVKARQKGLALYARFGGEWHAVKVGVEFAVPKRAVMTLNEELLLQAIEAEGSRFVVRWKLEDYLSSLVPGRAPTRSSVPRSHAKATPIVQPGPTIRLSDLPPAAAPPEPPPAKPAFENLVNGLVATVDEQVIGTPPAPSPTPTPSTPTKAPAPVPPELPLTRRRGQGQDQDTRQRPR